MNIMYVMKRIEQTGGSKGGKSLKSMPSQIFFYDEAGRAMWESVFGLENSLVEVRLKIYINCLCGGVLWLLKCFSFLFDAVE